MSQKILIIEDDRFLRELMTRKLSQEGFNVIEAVDGEEGFRKIKEENPALVLLDLILPKMDGFQVLSKIKEDERLCSIPVIILSNLGEKESIEKGIKLGVADYLIKVQHTPNEIVERIKQNLKSL